MLSDDSSSDSDTGIRFKTDSTRRPNASSDVDLSKNNDRGRGDRRLNNERIKDSYNRNDSHYRVRDRSPIRDDWSSRDRNRSDPQKSKSFNYNREKSSRENGNSDKYGSSSNRLREDDKYDKRSEKPERISRANKYESEQGPHGSKDRLSVRDRGNTRNNDEVVSNIRNAINRHLQPSKSESKGDKLKIDRESSASEEKQRSPKKVTHKYNKEDIKERSKSIEKEEPYIEKIYLTDDSKSPERSSDNEPKPVSYYNMKSVTIDQSASSADEDDLRKEVLLLKQKLKHTKEKKKSKHKDKKKHKKSKSSKSESCTSSNSYNNSEDLPSKAAFIDPIKKKQCEESNEEGEIVSESDSEDTKSDQDLKKLEMPDLREKLKAKTQDVVMGPSLPPRLEMVEENQDSQVEGPALPPHLMKPKKRQKNLGPTISEDHRKALEEAQDVNEISDNDDDVEIIGPLPAGCEEKWSNAHKNLEERALKLKIDAIEGPKPSDCKADVREEWMLKLPEGKIGNLGLGLVSRQFRAKEGPDLSDRSSWTDDPQQKALKAAGIVIEDEETVRKKLEQSAELDHIRKRDEEQEAEVKKHKKKSKRDTSLLDLHQKKLKKKKKKSDQDKDKQARRPFDRDIDLKANRFDEAQKKAILKKAQLLDTRFSSGESKFL